MSGKTRLAGDCPLEGTFNRAWPCGELRCLTTHTATQRPSRHQGPQSPRVRSALVVGTSARVQLVHPQEQSLSRVDRLDMPGHGVEELRSDPTAALTRADMEVVKERTPSLVRTWEGEGH